MSTSKVPQLPPTDDGEVNSLRYEVNPAVALNALTHIYKQVQQYQAQLRRLAQSIHQVYAEGPLVSGWLASEASLSSAVEASYNDATPAESAEPGPTPHAEERRSEQCHSEQVSAALFRHGDADDLMNYLSVLESTMAEPESSSNGGSTSQYYLCRLDSSGQIQAEKCPPDQVPVLSMAIARYQRLNQLIKQKQDIETKLQTVVDILGDAQQVLAD
ncbi:MAG: hypothetical protein AAGA46_14055 [Cyanobacteria bacterium P01_F01_bin.13]